ncbi:MAG: type II toxin-antitoxin system VapC family toxin [Pseudonocardia sp.]
MDDALHGAAMTAIRDARLGEDTFILPASVLSESLVAAHRASSQAAFSMRRDLIAFFGPARVIDEEVADTAARLRATHPSLRLPDALVIATGVIDDGAVLTCDKRLASVDARVQVLALD